jgi:hypothetical protein
MVFVSGKGVDHVLFVEASGNVSVEPVAGSVPWIKDGKQLIEVTSLDIFQMNEGVLDVLAKLILDPEFIRISLKKESVDTVECLFDLKTMNHQKYACCYQDTRKYHTPETRRFRRRGRNARVLFLDLALK